MSRMTRKGLILAGGFVYVILFKWYTTYTRHDVLKIAFFDCRLICNVAGERWLVAY